MKLYDQHLVLGWTFVAESTLTLIPIEATTGVILKQVGLEGFDGRITAAGRSDPELAILDVLLPMWLGATPDNRRLMRSYARVIARGGGVPEPIRAYAPDWFTRISDHGSLLERALSWIKGDP